MSPEEEYRVRVKRAMWALKAGFDFESVAKLYGISETTAAWARLKLGKT